MLMSEAVCAACGRTIDGAARLCPFCGANPATGEKVDTQTVLREVFQPREVTPAQSVVDFARHRQGVVIAGTVAVIFLLLAGLHQLVSLRNATAVTSGPAVPLTEITDLRDQSQDTPALPMPDLQFPYDGNSRVMRTFIVEPGAVAPPPPATTTQPPAAQTAPAPAAARPGVLPQRPGAAPQIR